MSEKNKDKQKDVNPFAQKEQVTQENIEKEEVEQTQYVAENV